MSLKAYDGSVVCWGSGEQGQHGLGTGLYNKQVNVESVASLGGIPLNVDYELACGASHTVCLTRDAVYVWGNGSDGQLGTGDLSNRDVPVCIQMPSDRGCKVLAGVACGAAHTIIWTSCGLCYGFGSNFNSQLALVSPGDSSHITKQSLPTLIKSIQHNAVEKVACGQSHTLFLYKCGTVACVGLNNHGQLGVGTRQDLSAPVVINNLESVKTLACGENHSLALTASGELYIWGYGKAIGYKYKDLVAPTRKLSHYTNIVQLAGGATHSLALTENGNIYSWGSGSEGQLGHGEAETFISKPTKISKDRIPSKVLQICAGSFLSVALSVDGIAYIWGKINHVKPSTYKDSVSFSPIPVELPGCSIQSINCGSWHIVASTRLKRDPKEQNQNETSAEATQVNESLNPTDSCTSRLPLIGQFANNRHNLISHYGEHRGSAVTVSEQYNDDDDDDDDDGDIAEDGMTVVHRERNITTLADFYSSSSDLPTHSTVLGSIMKESSAPAQTVKHVSDIILPALDCRPRINTVYNASSHGSPDSSSYLQPQSGHQSQERQTSLPKSKEVLQSPSEKESATRSPGVTKKHIDKSSTAVSFNNAKILGSLDRVDTDLSRGWNPHRNFSYDESSNQLTGHTNANQLANTMKSATNNSTKPQEVQVHQKNLGFIDMGKKQDRNTAHAKAKPAEIDRHSLLYSKEMSLRSESMSQKNSFFRSSSMVKSHSSPSKRDSSIANLTLRRVDTQLPHNDLAFKSLKIDQKATRRSQFSKPPSEAQIIRSKTHVRGGLHDLLEAEVRSAPLCADNTRNMRYNSMPTLERKQFTQEKQKSCISNLKTMYFSKKISFN